MPTKDSKIGFMYIIRVFAFLANTMRSVDTDTGFTMVLDSRVEVDAIILSGNSEVFTTSCLWHALCTGSKATFMNRLCFAI